MKDYLKIGAIALALLVFGWINHAPAQTTFTMPPPAGVILNGYQVVATCGAVSLSAGNLAFGTMDLSGNICGPGGAAAAGGLTNYFVQPGASDNHATIKASAGQVYKISITNNSATVNYIRLYNSGAGFNGCNSATNLIYANAIPASTSVGGLSDSWAQGMGGFTTGIAICITGAYGSTDTTNATASAMNVNIGYK